MRLTGTYELVQVVINDQLLSTPERAAAKAAAFGNMTYDWVPRRYACDYHIPRSGRHLAGVCCRIDKQRSAVLCEKVVSAD